MAKILLCDDSKFVLSVFEKRLSACGHKIVGKARDGEECVQLFAETKPDLLLLDITMPNKDGRTALREIMQKWPKASVVMVTAIGDEEVRSECMDYGAKAFVSKANITSDEDFKKYVIDIIEPLLSAGKAA